MTLTAVEIRRAEKYSTFDVPKSWRRILIEYDQFNFFNIGNPNLDVIPEIAGSSIAEEKMSSDLRILASTSKAPLAGHRGSRSFR
jgi:hypothetical protein